MAVTVLEIFETARRFLNERSEFVTGRQEAPGQPGLWTFEPPVPVRNIGSQLLLHVNQLDVHAPKQVYVVEFKKWLPLDDLEITPDILKINELTMKVNAEETI